MMNKRSDRPDLGNNPPAPHPWRRALALALSTVLAAIVLVALFVSYRIYADNRMMDRESTLPIAPAPAPGQSFLIFAPHCDDEVLGAGGLIYQATHKGCPVHVVVITNGDGFRISVSRTFHKINPTAYDFVRYGFKRQTETLTALKVLGVPPGDVAFLGYPDRGLMPMWTAYWSPSNPYRSMYTGYTRSPYSDSPTAGAPYCGAAVLADIMRQMEQDKPTDIYVTHPSDDHPDHAAASVFVRTALDRLRARGEPWAKAAHLHYYLVHRGDWPVPQGLHEDYPLSPPSQMANGETRWTELPLTHYQVERKYAAIKRYTTQVEMPTEARFVFSFARKTEIFGDVDSGASVPIARVPDGAMRIGGDLSGWTGVAPVDIDPVGDTVGRAMQGGADVARIFLARDTDRLYVRVDMGHTLSKDVVYGISLRPLRAGGAQPAFLRYDIRPGAAGADHELPTAPGVHYAWRDSTLEIAAPLSRIGLTSSDTGATLDVEADTQFAGLPVDRTGYFAVALSKPEAAVTTVARGIDTKPATAIPQ